MNIVKCDLHHICSAYYDLKDAHNVKGNFLHS